MFLNMQAEPQLEFFWTEYPNMVKSYILLCIFNPCIFEIFLQLKFVGADQAFQIFSFVFGFLLNFSLCGPLVKILMLFFSKLFATFCTYLEVVLIW